MSETRPLRVAQVMGKMVGGGIESVVMSYYRHIDHERVQFDLIVDSDSTLVPADEVESLGGRVIEVPPYQWQPANSRALERLFRTEGWSIVHSHMNSLSVFPLRAAKRAGVPVRIAHSHSTWGKGEVKRNVIKALLRTQANGYPTHRMACSRHAGEWLFGKNAEFTVLYNAVEIDKYLYSPDARRSVRMALGIPEDTFVFGSAGRLTAQKNQAFLLETFSVAFPEDGNELLLLIGDGPDRCAIENRIEELGLSNRVLMLGQRDDMGALYSAMDCFCLPSTYEGLGIVAVEAQVSGLPTLISTNVPSDVEITLNARYVPLETSKWAMTLRVMSELTGGRHGYANVSRFASYDITSAAPLLAGYYKRAFERLST